MTYESYSFGEADHLPDAEALLGINGEWHIRNLLATGEGSSSSIVRLPDAPDFVVRLHDRLESGADEHALGILARSGIRHFDQMTEAGLYVPPQRFVVAPSIFRGDNDTNYLYSFTDWLEGRTLTSGATDAEYAPAAIDGLAKYLLWIHDSHEPDVLWDKVYAWQFTVLKTGKVAMHDVGLDFQPAWKGNGKRVSNDVYASSLNLLDWAHNARIDKPESLDRLMRSIEPLPKRLVRQVMWKFTGRYESNDASTEA
jgi:hypothetical protein